MPREVKIKASILLASMAYLIGWIGLLHHGADARAVLVLLLAFLLARRDESYLRSLSGLLLFTTLASCSTRAFQWPAMVVLCLLAALMVRPTRPRRDIETAVLYSTILLLVMAAALALTASGDSARLLVTLAAGWWMTVRLATGRPGLTQLRWATGPAILAFVLLLWGWAWGDVAGLAERRAIQLVAEAHQEENRNRTLFLLQRAVKVHPWRPEIWNDIGLVEQRRSNTEGAFDAFKKGYSIRPGGKNPCLGGLAETAVLLKKWRTVVGLLREGGPPLGSMPREAAVPFAVELWRERRMSSALDLLKAQHDLSPGGRALAGWIASEMGDHRLALDLLSSLVESGESCGETIYRIGMASRVLGRERHARTVLSEGVELYPLHQGLRKANGLEAYTGCAHRVDPGGDGILLGNTVYLVGWEACPDPAHQGDTVTVCTSWAVAKPLLDMVMILHFDLGSPPRWRLNADHAPVGGNLPTSRWPVGEVMIDTAEVAIPSDAPLGTYKLFTGLWVPGDQESRLLPGVKHSHLIPRGEKRIPLGDIVVVAREPALR